MARDGGLRPMKAVSGELPADGTGWAYEVKWDGMRILATVEGGAADLRSSNGLEATGRFPELAGLAAAVGTDCVLDGEVVALDESGRPSFGILQRRMQLRRAADSARRAAMAPVVFAVFDVLRLAGHDTCPLPYVDRRRLLDDLVPTVARWRVTPTHDDGADLFAVAQAQGLEGVIAKRLDSPYHPGQRSPAWRKIKVRRRQELVVGGWWPGEGRRDGNVGSLLVGVHEPDAPGRPLRYAGRVGTGFSGAELDRLRGVLHAVADERCPFDPDPPSAVRRKGRWVRPEVVVEVEFAEWTVDGVLRHPAYLGQRYDKDAAAVVREEG